MASLDVTSMESRQLDFSIRRLAEELGMARETVQSRLTAANVQPCGRRNGHPVYRLRDVCPVLFGGVEYDADGEMSPAKMRPTARRAWYQSENDRLEFERRQGQLVEAADVETQMAKMATEIVRAMETLADRVERDRRVGPDVVEYLQDEVHAVRQALYESLSMADDDAHVGE